MFSRFVDCDRSLSIFIQIGTNGLVSIGNNYTWPELPDSRQVICVYCAFIDNTDSVGGQCGRDNFCRALFGDTLGVGCEMLSSLNISVESIGVLQFPQNSLSFFLFSFFFFKYVKYIAQGCCESVMDSFF